MIEAVAFEPVRFSIARPKMGRSLGSVFRRSLASNVGAGGGAQPYKAAVLADNPVYFVYAMTGATADDIGSGNNDGTYVNAPTLNVPSPITETGPLGVTLNGTSQCVASANAASLDLADVWTLEAWIKRTATQGTNQGIISKGSGGYYMRMGTGNKLELVKSGVSIIMASTTTITDTASWHHCMCTKTGATCKVYIDSVDVSGGLTAATTVDNADSLRVGSDGDAGNAALEFFNGSIALPAVYGTALAAARNLAHWNAR